MLHDNISVNEAGRLCFAGYDTVSLAKEYGTPLYLMDENMLRRNFRLYTEPMSRCFKSGSMPLYASKALSCKEMYRIAAAEGAGVDIVSSGELYTAIKAGFPTEKMYFHGNNKTDEDIRYAIDCGIGYFIVDNLEELEGINEYARERGIVQKILLRITPGIDPHTFEAVNTGMDCQFGIALDNGQAIDFVKNVLAAKNVRLEGFHCHIGSQVFEWTPFRDAAECMLRFISDVKKLYGYEAKVLNLGGGFGVRYVESDPFVDIPESIEKLARFIPERCRELGIDEPVILMEPGRSIVANAGMTIYTVGSFKTVEGFRNYVSVDGGMSDNPRYALYKSEYTVINADHADKESDTVCTVAGRCCESGALIQEDVALVKPVRGEHIAVCVTGAYNYSMASNYNRVARPAMVMLSDEGVRVIIKRETLEDLVRNDV